MSKYEPGTRLRVTSPTGTYETVVDAWGCHMGTNATEGGHCSVEIIGTGEPVPRGCVMENVVFFNEPEEFSS